MALKTFLGAFEMVPVTAAVAERGGLLRRDFGRSHNTGLADALIAATVQETGARLVTLHVKHFPMLTHHLVPYTKGGGEG